MNEQELDKELAKHRWKAPFVMIHCRAEGKQEENCPYLRYCLVGMVTNNGIVGCNLPLIWNGLLDKKFATMLHLGERK